MNSKSILIAAALSLAAVTAQAQGVERGAVQGAREGHHDAGPVGAVVGGAVGAVVGGVNGLLGVDDRPRFRSYVIEQGHPSYHYDGEIVVGTVLPSDGVTFYDVPGDYHLSGYDYTVVDGRTVLVDPRSRRIVQIID